MSISCPISNRRVDSRMARTVSLQVAIFTSLFVYTHHFAFAILVFVDFSIRALKKEDFSPFYRVGQILLDTFNIKPKLCDALPKQFALYMGLSVSIAIIFFYILGLFLPIEYASYTFFPVVIISVLLIIFALLEALLGFCMGCKIYYVIQLVKGIFK